MRYRGVRQILLEEDDNGDVSVDFSDMYLNVVQQVQEHRNPLQQPAQ